VFVVTVVFIVVKPLSSQYCVPDVQFPVGSALNANEKPNKLININGKKKS
jgi:hypothetical protein